MDQTIINNVERELFAAVKNADIPVLERLLHHDLLFNLPDGQTVTKEIDIQTYRSGKMKIDLLEASNELVNIIGDSAIVCVTVLLKGTYEGLPVNGTFRYIRVWKQTDDGLKVIAGSCVAAQNQN